MALTTATEEGKREKKASGGSGGIKEGGVPPLLVRPASLNVPSASQAGLCCVMMVGGLGVGEVTCLPLAGINK